MNKILLFSVNKLTWDTFFIYFSEFGQNEFLYLCTIFFFSRNNSRCCSSFQFVRIIIWCDGYMQVLNKFLKGNCNANL